MITLKILTQPRRSIFSELFPFYRWKNQLKDAGIKVEMFDDAEDTRLRGGDRLLIQSKHYSRGWRNIKTRTPQNQQELINFLVDIKRDTNKLIWFDQSDSSGFQDFPIISYVDTFIVKQMLKDTSYYTEASGSKNFRIWLNNEAESDLIGFTPCPKDQLHKLRLGWNIGYNDYRVFRQIFKFLSNHIGYGIYPLSITKPNRHRELDLSYRGKVNYGNVKSISIQRNNILKVLNTVDSEIKIAKGGRIPKGAYLQELKNSKVCISPFGYGEICYRDFESFLAGTLLIKPSMEHLNTFPNVYIPGETYVPILWDLSDLRERLEDVVANYPSYIHIAQHGQENYLNIVNNPENFIGAVRRIIE